jgi:hypothetical protein
MRDNWFWKLGARFIQTDSMHITNDPRFFAGNVMDKRLAALKTLTLVSSIMFGTALGQCFALKKNMDFSKTDMGVLDIAVWQMVGFCLALLVSVQCLLSLYIIAQQLFYTYRLMTAGSLGFDIAAVFYLTRTITMWRHLAIKALFSGLLKFLVLVGIQLFVKFYKEANSLKSKHHHVMIVNFDNMNSVNETVFEIAAATHKLDLRVHTAIGYTVFSICMATAVGMFYINKHHQTVFAENYKHCEQQTSSIQSAFLEMSTRGANLGMIET